MKKLYDKLILVLALLALLGGAALYFLKSDVTSQQAAAGDAEPAGNPYQPIPIPEPSAKTASWPEPEHQSSGPNWLYDVFTPPKIYIDRQGNFTAEPPKVIDQDEPFGVYLAKMERMPYRIQMQGYSGDRDKPGEAVLFFFDEERQLRFFIREGQTNDESEVEVLDFTIEREIDDDNNVDVTAVATILDKRSGEEVKLNDEERLFSSEVTLLFRSEEDSEVEVELMIDPQEPTTAFQTSAGEFVLKEINLEDQTVTVEKKATEDMESRTLTLSPTIYQKPEDTQPNVEAEEDSSNDAEFDFAF
ncbi:hypothetical protein DDZ13_01610 [Coraliomargarita sinensis]|uniref:Uncharacterized protein n=1 Tax=Coraliomargarita sinensis TaxID=2174842 RepID=A0A317ZN32_9BACT|nr:hypothetical protein [Coraliomargarita sinensis]PXA05597.1 hypothetical protein DDZ13_01610 [Coraliomargarita sinensis]